MGAIGEKSVSDPIKCPSLSAMSRLFSITCRGTSGTGSMTETMISLGLGFSSSGPYRVLGFRVQG